MDVITPPTPGERREPAATERLDSWKEIAAYLKRDESTVRRWEEEGLPIHRHPHKKKSTVFAYTSELDAWWHAGQRQLESVATTGHQLLENFEIARDPQLERAATIEPQARPAKQRWVIAATAVLLATAMAATLGLRRYVFTRPRVGEISSIAVLPLKNLSATPGQDYFADGMTEALITELGKIGALRVLSHQTADAYRQSAKPVPEIARELKVDAVLEGTVLSSGNRVRITANLVQATPERHLWAESYEFDRQDVLIVQGEVAREVAKQIRITITPEEQTRLTRSRRVDPEAHADYELGRAFMFRAMTPTDGRRAKEHFDKAIARDPGYAEAYASLAELYITARASPLRNPADQSREARRCAERALKLDDTLAEAHNALARVAQRGFDWAGAEREYRRALETNPNSVARIWYAMFLYGMQRFDEAVSQARLAQQLDPASPSTNTWAGVAYLFAGRTAEAWAAWQRALELDPNYSDAILVVARTHVSEKKYTQAIADLERALSARKEPEPLLIGALAHAYGRAGDRKAALKLIQQLERIGRPDAQESVPPFGLIWAYAGIADNNRAFARLERAREEGAFRLTWLNVDPLLDPLRSDPRFDDLVRRVNLPTPNPTRSR